MSNNGPVSLGVISYIPRMVLQWLKISCRPYIMQSVGLGPIYMNVQV